MKEPVDNIGPACPVHGPKPDPELAQKPPSFFVGKFVKLGFPATLKGAPVTEHMWVKVLEVRGDELVGALDNDPVVATEYQCGDHLAFVPAEVEAILDDPGTGR